MASSNQNQPSGLRILLIDDEGDFVETLADSLRLKGYQVETALNAAEALTRQESFIPDIALVDIRLGRDSGLDLVAKFREIDPDLICVMVTAYSDAKSAVRALQSGAYDYLSKPFHPDELGAVINRCAEKKQLVDKHRAAIRALQESEEHFRTLFHTSPGAVALVRANDMVVDDVNERALALLRMDRTDIVGVNIGDLKLTPDQKKRADFYRQLDEFGFVNDVEGELETSDGERISCLLSGTTLYFQGEKYYVLNAIDITPISMANNQLRESEQSYRRLSQQFETLLDGITDALLLMSKDCKVIWANQGAARHFGSTVESMRGEGCYQLWSRSGETDCDLCIKGVVATGRSSEFMQRFTDGRVWGVKSYPIRNPDGEVESVIQIITDLTEKNRLREEASRQSHLAALGELAAGVAHEINNPTGMIMRSMPMIKDALRDAEPILDRYFDENGDFAFAGLPYSEMKEQITTIVGDVRDCALRIKRIVDDLKDFSQPQDEENPRSFDLGDTIVKAGRLMHNLIKNSTDFYSCEIEDDLPLTEGQPQRIEQVTLNLIQNACLALTTRSESISVRVFHDTLRRMNVVEIKDQGCGIATAELEHILEPFYTTRREKGGSGLGLSVSSRIIADHNGRLEIESTPGAGSLFRVLLPVAESQSL